MGSEQPEQPEPAPGGTAEPKPLPGAAAFIGMGLSAAVCVAIGVVLGVWGDSAWHTAPLCLMIGLALGLVAAVCLVVTQIREYL
jgi:F0F1-type ATP synthase assembly protein I